MVDIIKALGIADYLTVIRKDDIDGLENSVNS